MARDSHYSVRSAGGYLHEGGQDDIQCIWIFYSLSNSASSDTLRRHVRQSHPGSEPIMPVRQACINCRSLKTRCDGGPPCTGCLRHNVPCSFRPQPRVAKKAHGPREVIEPSHSEKTQRFLQLYFEHFHPFWPFVHRGSFNQSNEMPLLVQSMVVVGMWVEDLPNTRSAAIDLHKTLNTAIYQQRVCLPLLSCPGTST